MSAWVRSNAYCRQSSSIVVGVCLGIAFSLIITPLVEQETGSSDDCAAALSLSFQIRSSPYGQPLRQSPNAHPLQSVAPMEEAVVVADDFEPVLNLQNKPKKRQRAAKKLVRPRYYSTELNMKEKLFVGVFASSSSGSTTQKQQTLSEHGIVFNKTVGHHVNKLVFFVNNMPQIGLNSTLSGMTVVNIADDRPLLKPFHVVRYIGEHYAKDYDFFFLVVDTTYVRALALKELVQHISVGQNVHLGQKTDDGSVGYCSVTAGILLSRTLLQSVLQQLDWCIKNSFSDSMDDNLGRCILHSTNTPCAQELQGTRFFSYELNKMHNSKSALTPLLRSQLFCQTVTVTALPSPNVMFHLQQLFSNLELKNSVIKIEDLRQKIRNMSRLEPDHGRSIPWPIGSPVQFRVTDRFDVIRWDYFTMTHLYLDNDFSNVKVLSDVDAKDISDVLNSTLIYIKQRHGKKFEFRRLLNGYRRFDPTRGMEYTLDLAFRDKENGLEVHKRMEAVRVLGNVEIIPIPYVTENTRITLVLVVTLNNHNRISRFLEDYAKVCLETQDNTVLSLVFIYDPRSPGKGNKNDVYSAEKNLLNSYANKYRSRGAKLSWISIKSSGISPSEFGLLDLVVRKFQVDTLFLLCKPNMEIKAEFLNRVRMNTIQGWQVFVPIPFVQYHPSIVYPEKVTPATIEVNKNYGHFDIHNYEHMSFYGSDYLAGRKAIEAEVPLVRLDKDLHNDKHRHLKFGVYHMFVKLGTVHVLRSPEPALLVRYVFRTCEPTQNEESYQECLYNRAEGLGTRGQLAALILDKMKPADDKPKEDVKQEMRFLQKKLPNFR